MPAAGDEDEARQFALAGFSVRLGIARFGRGVLLNEHWGGDFILRPFQ